MEEKNKNVDPEQPMNDDTVVAQQPEQSTLVDAPVPSDSQEADGDAAGQNGDGNTSANTAPDAGEGAGSAAPEAAAVDGTGSAAPEAAAVEGAPEEPKKKLSKGAKIGIIVGGVVAAIVIIAIIAFSTISSQEAQKHDEYVKNLNTVLVNGLSTASQAESICNTTKSIWYSAIFDSKKTWSSDIQKYHSDDFNDALSKYHSDTATIAKMAQMKSDCDKLDTLLKQMKDPPEDLKEAYSAAKEFVSSVDEFVDMAASPSGSLQTFSSKFSSIDSEVMKKYKALEREIPETTASNTK